MGSMHRGKRPPLSTKQSGEAKGPNNPVYRGSPPTAHPRQTGKRPVSIALQYPEATGVISCGFFLGLFPALNAFNK